MRKSLHQYARHEGDTGSVGVRVALSLAREINHPLTAEALAPNNTTFTYRGLMKKNQVANRNACILA